MDTEFKQECKLFVYSMREDILMQERLRKQGVPQYDVLKQLITKANLLKSNSIDG